MRQVWIEVPRGCGARAFDIARGSGGTNLARLEATGEGGPVDLVLAYVPNGRVGELLGELQGLPELRVMFAPRGVLPLRPPSGEAAQQVTDVQPRSPLEVYLSGLQSVGSWRAFLGYAARVQADHVEQVPDQAVHPPGGVRDDVE